MTTFCFHNPNCNKCKNGMHSSNKCLKLIYKEISQKIHVNGKYRNFTFTYKNIKFKLYSAKLNSNKKNSNKKNSNKKNSNKKKYYCVLECDLDIDIHYGNAKPLSLYINNKYSDDYDYDHPIEIKSIHYFGEFYDFIYKIL